MTQHDDGVYVSGSLSISKCSSRVSIKSSSTKFQDDLQDIPGEISSKIPGDFHGHLFSRGFTQLTAGEYLWTEL